MMSIEAFAEIVKNLDSRQKEAVYCDTNCVVTAGAGSGKTTVLSYRFLWLVSQGFAHVDEILTLTFSRAAATEMHERIHQKLLDFQDDPDIRAEIGRFSDATITTIDAFCNRVVASDPTRYGIGPEYIMDEEANQEMASECAHQLLTSLEDDEGLKFLAALYSPDDLLLFLVKLAHQEFHPASTYDASEQARGTYTYIRSLYEHAIETLLQQLRVLIDIPGNGKGYTSAVSVAQAYAAESEMLHQCENPEAVLAYLEACKINKCRGKQDFVAPFNAQIDEIRKTLIAVRKACAALCDAPLLLPVFTVLGRYHELYLAAKRERGILTFSDIAHMALDILQHNLPVRSYYQKKFRFIMIDEFQDTNTLQKDIVYLLAEQYPNGPLASDKLFFVGDDKQSIYRFRGADVSVFKGIGAEIEAQGGKTIPLAYNYRSEPTLIDFFNIIFQLSMGDDNAPYEAAFEPLSSRKANKGISPKVSFLIKRLADEEDAESDSENDSEEQEDDPDAYVLDVQAEAYAIACRIQRMIHSDEYLIVDEHGVVRRPKYHEIAVLFRTSSNQLHYEKALRIAGIPYTLSAVQSLFLEAPMNDIYSILQLIIFHEDRLAFAAVLRSPLCRLSDDALITVLDVMEQDGESAFFDISAAPLSAEDAQKYAVCQKLYRELVHLARGGSVAQLVSHIWYAGGYRLYLLGDPLYQVYLQHFDFIHELAVQYDMQERGLAPFLDYVRPRLGQNMKLENVEPLRDTIEGVQLMTIHKSKGLEFPIVFLANLGGMPSPKKTPAWQQIEHEAKRLLIPRHMRLYEKTTNLAYDQQKETLANMETAEMKRLLYVALTRAQNHLILSGYANQKNLGEKMVGKNFLAHLAYTTPVLDNPATCGSYCSVESIEDAPKRVLHATVSHKQIHNRLTAMSLAYQNPHAPREYPKSSYAVTQLAHETPDYSAFYAMQGEALPAIAADSILIERGLTAVFGTWVHSLLERAINDAGEYSVDMQMSMRDALLVMPKEISRADLTSSELQTLVDSALVLANNVLSSKFLHNLLSGSSIPAAVESEVRFALCVDGDELRSAGIEHTSFPPTESVILNGSIDLLLRYEDCVKIVDFKTDSTIMRSAHEQQLTIYRMAAERLYNLPVYAALCYTRAVGNEVWLG